VQRKNDQKKKKTAILAMGRSSRVSGHWFLKLKFEVDIGCDFCPEQKHQSPRSSGLLCIPEGPQN
jgi:hypothetical protein